MHYRTYYKYIKLFLNTFSRIGSKRKVDFLICGAQKAGTSALHKYISMHHKISMARIKEVHFFDKNYLFLGNRSFYPIYHSNFDFKDGCKLLGEATPNYMFFKDIPKRIWKYNTEIKLIIILRDPIERAYSQWYMLRDMKLESRSFLQSIKNDYKPKRAYIDRGFYVEQIKRIWNFFPKEQTLILKNKSLKSDPLNTLNRVYKFLGVSLINEIEPLNVNSRKYSEKISSEAREYLLNVYEDEIKNLEKLLDWDCSDWLKI